MPANTGAAGAIYRTACFAGMPAPTMTAQASEFRQDSGSLQSSQMTR